MELGPILRAMLRNKLGVILIALQIAFTMTVIVNSIFIINERSRLMARPSGLDEDSLFWVQSIAFREDHNEESMVVEDRAVLEAIPGIESVTVISAVPLSTSGSSTGVRVEPDETRPSIGTAIYRVDPYAIDTLGLELLSGENFTGIDMQLTGPGDNSPSSRAIITETLANELFADAGAAAVGRTVFMSGNRPVQIVGVVRQLQAPWPQTSFVENSLMVPANTLDQNTIYMVRTEAGRVNELMVLAEEALAAANPGRLLLNMQSLAETREQTYRVDSSMSRILVVVIITLVFITSMGIVGLAVYSINRRRRQIGTRRALGATRGEIMRYFVVENLLISTIGVSLGAVLTIGFNIFLVQAFNMPRIDWYYTPLGMLILMLVGLIAVLGPSRNAAQVPPALATRSV